jgi:hypothetical protein
VPRRVSLPSADDLFRPTEDDSSEVEQRSTSTRSTKRGPVRAVPDRPEPEPPAERRPSGRVRHDEKMTVYITSGELLEIEHARLSLRSQHGLAVDRGRLVREAISIVLADLEAKGTASALVRRLTEE